MHAGEYKVLTALNMVQDREHSCPTVLMTRKENVRQPPVFLVFYPQKMWFIKRCPHNSTQWTQGAWNLDRPTQLFLKFQEATRTSAGH